MQPNVYLDLTRELNDGRLRAVICSGQAVVLHRLAVMSKDGDWMVREDPRDLEHVLAVLERHGAHMRFGAPLDARWLAGGWSSHFEFRQEALRVRTDFFSRPPRLGLADIERIWREQEGRDPPFFGVVDLAMLKRTEREKDWAVIGELARLMQEPRDRLRHSRSARELEALVAQHPALVATLLSERPILGLAARGRDVLERALDEERRQHMRANEERLQRYAAAAAAWAERWPTVQASVRGLPLRAAHQRITTAADGILPYDLR